MDTLGIIAAVAGVLALAGIIAAALLGDPDADRRRTIDADADRRRAAARRQAAARKEANR